MGNQPPGKNYKGCGRVRTRDDVTLSTTQIRVIRFNQGFKRSSEYDLGQDFKMFIFNLLPQTLWIF